MIEIGKRRRNLPAPPHIVAASLTTPDSDPARPWLRLLRDEQRPTVVEAHPPELVVWSSLWPSRPDVLVRFELVPSANHGTDLTFVLLADEPAPDASKTGHLRQRINQLLSADLRFSYGQ